MSAPEIVAHLVIYMVVLVFAVSIHEAAHAWMSHKFGDDTALMLGRVTLNPAKHIDPLGTLLFPVIGFLFAMQGSSIARIAIGWGKPTPVNPLNWREKNLANIMVSAAGVLANLATAIVALIILKALQYSGAMTPSSTFSVPVSLLLTTALFTNVSLFVFNLLPFPPLDGSKIVETYLPSSFDSLWQVLQQFGFMILLALMYMGVFQIIFSPVRAFLDYLIYI